MSNARRDRQQMRPRGTKFQDPAMLRWEKSIKQAQTGNSWGTPKAQKGPEFPCVGGFGSLDGPDERCLLGWLAGRAGSGTDRRATPHSAH
ncbi:hypothetical protein CP533_2772 [Ophiocordyceps camponoti-saundersi (nom. inval.)]|nr:hypothetical protein CP533_2772 [Ophiocordyceps camponoti-saundersi (nom. inval.)]